MEIKRFPLGFLWTNCYLLWDEDGAAFVVDPGGDPKEVMGFIDAWARRSSHGDRTAPEDFS